jgi:hypothetical protein
MATTKFNMKKLRNRVKARQAHYLSSYQSKHRDLSRSIMPERGRFDDEAEPDDGKNRFTKLVDHTAGVAAGNLAAALLDGLSSPYREWTRFETKQKDLMEIASVKKHMEEVNRVIQQALQDSNFYNSISDFYEEIVLFGTAALFIESDPVDDLRFSSFTMGEYYIGADSSARVNQWYRRFPDTADNIADRFGEDTISLATKGLLEDSGHTYVNLVHAIEPNKERDRTKEDNTNMPFRSVYYEEGTSCEAPPLSVSGYNDMPVIVARYRTVGSEVYGQSPCNRALGITKTLQEAVKDFWAASKKTISPPVNRPVQLKGKKIGAGTASHYDGAQGAPVVKPLYQISYDMQGNLAASDQIRDAINKILKSNLFSAISAIDRSNMTATEVSQRVAEAFRQLIAVVTRMNSEALKPILERVYNLLDEAGMFPEPPEELEGEKLDIVFISSLAQAQQAVGITSVEQIIDLVTRLAQIDPTIVDKFNADEALNEVLRMNGAPVDIVRSNEDTEAIREARRVQEQQEKTAAVMSQMAEGAEKLGNTPMNTGSALDTVMGGLQGAA